MAYNKILPASNALCRFLTWPPASLATSCLFDINNNVFLQLVQYIQPVQRLQAFVV